jgi:hypothetical protein
MSPDRSMGVVAIATTLFFVLHFRVIVQTEVFAIGWWLVVGWFVCTITLNQ